jgi:predicted secreted hydrolase
MKQHLYVAFLLGVLSTFTYAQDWKVYPYTPAGEIAFPVDEGKHPAEETEWWYTTGHLVGQTSGKNYSYMCTFIYFPQAGFDGLRILNITDDDTGAFFQDVKPLNYTTLSTIGLDFEAVIFLGGTEYWRTKIDGGNPVPFEYELFAANNNHGIDLDIETTKRPLILGDDGFFPQGLDSFTHYYAQTMNTVTGNVTFNGVTEAVVGTSWIDRQYGSYNAFAGERYEWFNMQLSNGMDLSLWTIFTVDYTTPETAEYRNLSAYVDESTQYTTNDLQIERLQYFCTPDEVQCYSKQWRITSTTNHDIDLILSTLHETNEVQLPIRFFEGALEVTGTIDGVPVTGKGFAELLHSYENPELTITSPLGGLYDASTPIAWTLNNPDDGSPMTYDLEYSIGDQNNFLPLVSGLENTSYLWNNPPISANDDIWFRITASSIDGTLTSTIISDMATVATLEVSQVDAKKTRMFPNPVLNELSIIFNKDSAGRFHIFDMYGKLILESKRVSTNTWTINTSQLHSGVYFINLITENNSSTYKFIKR